MAYTNVYLTAILADIGQTIADKLTRSFGLLSNVSKYVVKHGESVVTIPLPGAISSSTRAAGSVSPTPGNPTDTVATITPNTEYSYVLGIDRIQGARSIVDLLQFYKASIIDAVLGGMNTALWNLYSSITTNVVGTTSTPAGPELLDQAWTLLWNCKAPMSEVRACIGGAEVQSWKNTLGLWSNAGPAGQDTLINGRIGRRSGFAVDDDQQRKLSGGVAYNLAYAPQAFGLGFRNEMDKRPGTELDFWLPPAGIVAPAIFVERAGMDESTYGVGTKINVFCIGGVAVVKEDWACIVRGTASV